MNRSKKVRLLTMMAVFFLLATACGDDDSSDTTAATTPLCAVDGELRQATLLLPFPLVIGFPPIYGAKSLGYYEEEGLDLSIETASGGAAVVQQIAAGNAEFGLTPPGPIIIAAAAGQDLIVPYVYRTQLVFGLVGPEDSDIEDLSDLAGTTIGVSEATGGEVPFLEAILVSNGLTPGVDVEIVETGGGAATAAALDANRVDTYFSDFFNTLELSFEMPLQTYDIGEFESLHSGSVMVSNELVANDPNLIICLGRAIARATERTYASPEAMIAILSEDYGDQITDPEFDLLFLEQVLTADVQYEDSGGLWGWNRAQSWELYVDLLTSQGEVTQVLDPASLHTNEFIDAINDFDRAAEIEAAGG